MRNDLGEFRGSDSCVRVLLSWLGPPSSSVLWCMWLLICHTITGLTRPARNILSAKGLLFFILSYSGFLSETEHSPVRRHCAAHPVCGIFAPLLLVRLHYLLHRQIPLCGVIYSCTRLLMCDVFILLHNKWLLCLSWYTLDGDTPTA